MSMSKFNYESLTLVSVYIVLSWKILEHSIMEHCGKSWKVTTEVSGIT